MNIETLIVTMHQTDHSLAKKMNVQTNAVIGNQGNDISTQIDFLNGNQIIYLNTTDRGVGKNRNLVLSYAKGDICVFADDDMRFVDGYPQIVEQAALQCPDADILIFNLIEKSPVRYVIKKKKRITGRNYARYGAARLAVFQKSVKTAGITFTTLFGGGCKYGSGEDTVFLKECLDNGLKIYAVPYALAEIDQAAPSSWFHGYDGKYFFDKGAFFCALYPRIKWLICVRYLLRNYPKYKKQYSMISAFRSMVRGMRSFDREEFENEQRTR